MLIGHVRSRSTDSTHPISLIFYPVDTMVVQLSSVVAQRGFWSQPSSDRFYPCPVADACLPGVNGSRSTCAEGYTGIVCSVCADGFFEQFGRYTALT